MRFFLSLVLFCSSWGMGVEKPLRVYCYDALSGKDSFGEYLTKEFFKKTGIQVQFVSFGTAGEAANQILLEGKDTQADLLMGLDQILFQKLRDKDLFEPIDPLLTKEIEPSLFEVKENSFVPFDFGYLAFLYDSSRTQIASSLNLRNFPGQFKGRKKIVLQDPRTSSLGLEFLVWTQEVLGKDFTNFWKEIMPYILTVSPGWSGAYELFLRKQSDFVLSYTTSPAYHRMRENRHDIKPIFFEEGHFQQVEGLLILKKSLQKENAKKFLSFVIGKEAQEKIPTFQWMYPARYGTALPSVFKEIPIPRKIKVDWQRVKKEKDQWVQAWALMLSQGNK